MLQRFIAYIDRLGDRLSPVTVMECRREYRGFGSGFLTAGFYLLIATAALLGFNCEPEIQSFLRELRRHDYLAERFSWVVVIGFLLFFCYGSFMVFIMTLPRSFGWWHNNTAVHPDFFLSPMPRRAVFGGYYQLWILKTIALFFRLLPFLVLAKALGILTFPWLLFYPLVYLVLVVTLGNIWVPVFALSVNPPQKRPELVGGIGDFIVGFVGMIFVVPFILLPNWVAIVIFVTFVDVYIGPIAHPPLENCEGIADFRYWFPMFLLGVLVFNLAAWRLVRYNMRKEGSGPKKLLVTYLVNTGLLFTFAGLWFALWFVFR